MNVLIDTSVWVDHFRHKNDALVSIIEMDRAVIHPMIVLEIACGTPPAPRQQTLAYLGWLRACEQATPDEVMALIEREKLYGLGCGLVDLTLLACTLLTPQTQLWTLDRRLMQLAERLGVAHRPMH